MQLTIVPRNRAREASFIRCGAPLERAMSSSAVPQEPPGSRLKFEARHPLIQPPDRAHKFAAFPAKATDGRSEAELYLGQR